MICINFRCLSCEEVLGTLCTELGKLQSEEAPFLARHVRLTLYSGGHALRVGGSGGHTLNGPGNVTGENH